MLGCQTTVQRFECPRLDLIIHAPSNNIFLRHDRPIISADEAVERVERRMKASNKKWDGDTPPLPTLDDLQELPI